MFIIIPPKKVVFDGLRLIINLFRLLTYVMIHMFFARNISKRSGMSKKSITLIIAAFALNTHAQVTFQKTYGGANNDYGSSIKQTADGGYILTGTTESFGAGLGNVYLVKTNSMGDTLWTRTIGDSIDYQGGESVLQTSDGGFIISGYAWDTLLGSVVYLIKTDANGNILWRNCFEGGEGYSVCQNNDNGFIICGTIGSGFGSTDLSLIRTDSLGNSQWIKFFHLGGNENGYAAQQTSDGGFIVAGTVGPSFYYAFLLKTNASGNITWCKWYSAGALSYLGNCMQQTTDGGFIIGGSTGSSPLLFKTNSAGNVIWSKEYQNLGVAAYSLQQTNDQGYIVSCLNSNWTTNQTSPSLLKTDSMGNIIWAMAYLGSNDIFNSSFPKAQQTSDGGYILCSSIDSIGAGGTDIYLIKTDSSGMSGCNDSAISVVASATVTTLTNIIQNIFSGVTANTPNAVVGSGCTVTTLCQNISSGTNAINVDQTLISVYPNPFVSSAHIVFRLNMPQNIILNIFDMNGRLVTTFENKKFDAGVNELMWNTDNVNAGIYFLRMLTGEKVQTEKLILVK